MDPVSKRLAQVDSEASDLADQLVEARNDWVTEKDPANKTIRKTIYEDLMLRMTRVNSRMVALEAKLSINGGCLSIGAGRQNAVSNP